MKLTVLRLVGEIEVFLVVAVAVHPQRDAVTLQLDQRRSGDATVAPPPAGDARGCRHRRNRRHHRRRRPIEDPRVRFRIAYEVVRVFELHARRRAARGEDGAVGQSKRTTRLPDVRRDEGVDLTDGGQSVVIQTIGDVVGIPLRLGTMVGGDDIVITRVDDTGIV